MTRRFWSKVEELGEFAARFVCADTQLTVLSGPAGAGKSHLLANLVQDAQSRGQPALLLLGEYFLSSDEPWRQLGARIGWQSDIEDLLAIFHFEAEVAGRPTLLCIDALNESSDRKLWRSHLQAFAARLAKYPNIRLIVSCRDDFAELTLPSAIAERRDSAWSSIEHEGFGENIFEAVASYFSGYRIRSKHFPPLLTEFQNPLFLKTFCEAFEGSPLPDGPITLSTVMEARIQRICERLLHEIDCQEDTTRQAIALIAQKIEAAAGQPVPRPELRPAIDALFPGRGESQSLYRHLRSNGLLVEVIRDGVGEAQHVSVRFPFERFAHYFIADQMLRQHATFDTLRDAWSADGTIARFTESRGYGPLRGLARAMAILVPERFGREFINILPNGEAHELGWKISSIRFRGAARCRSRMKVATSSERRSMLAIATSSAHFSRSRPYLDILITRSFSMSG